MTEEQVTALLSRLAKLADLWGADDVRSAIKLIRAQRSQITRNSKREANDALFAAKSASS